MSQSTAMQRVVIDNVSPAVDGGRFPIKRIVGESVLVSADIFADGHDELDVLLLHRSTTADEWTETPMSLDVNDRWYGAFDLETIGHYEYSIIAWVDPFKSWATKLTKRVGAGQDTTVDLEIGANILEESSSRATGDDAIRLLQLASALRMDGHSREEAETAALGDECATLASAYADRTNATTCDVAFGVTVDRRRALFSSWYEMFPRSCSPTPGAHGTLRDCEARLPYVAELGFNVLYLPPIHPVGLTARKGSNNSVTSAQGDPGTPWAIGSAEGGHKSIHPELGTLADFRHLLEAAGSYGIEIALDIALQCSPDHPYVTKHPDWFHWRPDGTVQYAENPPKKYQDIYPLEFDTDDWPALWQELKSIFEFWIDQGVRIFRVDNPHTKPFAFWEWLIVSLKAKHPDLIFLAEAFTRPRVMQRLAKLGFSQSYTYFTWRRSKWELVEYATELTTTGVSEYFRPNFWPNTPDILMDYLQEGGTPSFKARLVLAATLSSNFGIYGPAFELCVNTPREEGSEEYLNSEKYEIKHWDLQSPDSIRDVVARVNTIRAAHPALQRTNNLTIHEIDNDQLIAYSKIDEQTNDLILTVVNIDPWHTQSGWIRTDFGALGIDQGTQFTVQDLLNGNTYTWRGMHNFIELNPNEMPAHIFEVVVPTLEKNT